MIQDPGPGKGLLSRLTRSVAGGVPEPPGLGAAPLFEHREIWWGPGQSAAALDVWGGHGQTAALSLPDGDAVARAAARIESDPRVLPVVVLDCETTGLARGQVIPFVIGVAWAEGDRGWCVHQWILRSYAGEVMMLRDLATRIKGLGPCRIVTYNGSSFDLPVLRSRGVRCGLDLGVLEQSHLDALTVARRLWRLRLPDCRLTTLERTWLGLHRVGDIASADIPEVFQDWLLDPGPATETRMQAVGDHNSADVLALAALLTEMDRCLHGPGTPSEALGAARHFLAAGLRAQARPVLEQAANAADAPGEVLRAAGLLLARECRRDQDWAGVERVWRRLVRLFPGDPAVHEGLAKHLEHQARAPTEALAVARASREPCPRRLERLERKVRV